MKKIAIDARILFKESGGIGRYASNLITEISKIDTKNQYYIIITPRDESEYKITSPNFHKLVVDVPHFSYGEQYRLLSVLNKEKFDLVHFTNFNHPILYRRPFVVTVHDLIMHLFPSGRQTKSVIRKYAYRLTMADTRRARRVIVPSAASKKDLVEMLHFPPEKIVVTEEGSEERFTAASPEKIQAVRKKYNLPEKYALFVSRWEEYKGVTRLIDAFEKLQPKFPELGLVICGKPAKQAPQVGEYVFEHQKNSNGKIITPGFVTDEDLNALYSGASVYVHPSLYEGFGIMILEAFSCGVPVVTSNNSSLSEVAGDAALLVDPTNIDELANAIAKVVADDDTANTLRKKGAERVKQFSWSKMAEKTLAAYREALNV